MPRAERIGLSHPRCAVSGPAHSHPQLYGGSGEGLMESEGVFGPGTSPAVSTTPAPNLSCLDFCSHNSPSGECL